MPHDAYTVGMVTSVITTAAVCAVAPRYAPLAGVAAGALAMVMLWLLRGGR